MLVCDCQGFICCQNGVKSAQHSCIYIYIYTLCLWTPTLANHSPKLDALWSLFSESVSFSHSGFEDLSCCTGLTVRSRLCLALSCQSSPKLLVTYLSILGHCSHPSVYQSSSLASDISHLARAIPNTSPIEYNVLCKRLQSNISDLNCTYRAILSCSKAKCSFIAKLKVLHAKHSYRKWQSWKAALIMSKSLAIGVQAEWTVRTCLHWRASLI